MGTEHRDRRLGDVPQGLRRVRVDRELHDVHPARPVAVERRVHLVRNRAEVLADDVGAVAVRLEADDRPQLLRRVAHVGALACCEALGNPPLTVEAHHVVDPEQACVPEVRSQAGAERGERLRGHRVGSLGREAPTLAARLERVGRRPDRHVDRVVLGRGPHVVSVPVTPEREVQREHLPAAVQLDGQLVELLGGDPLHIAVVQIGDRVDVGETDHALTHPRRPFPPVGPVALADRGGSARDFATSGFSARKFRNAPSRSGGPVAIERTSSSRISRRSAAPRRCWSHGSSRSARVSGRECAAPETGRGLR